MTKKVRYSIINKLLYRIILEKKQLDRKIINSGFYIGKIHRLSNRLMNHILLERGIQAFNGEQGRILHALWQKNYQSQTELSEQTGLMLNTLTKMIDRMIRMKLVERCSHEKDKRKKMICLTDYAKGLKAEYDAISDEIIEIFYSGFSDLEISEFEIYLERILVNLIQSKRMKHERVNQISHQSMAVSVRSYLGSCLDIGFVYLACFNFGSWAWNFHQFQKKLGWCRYRNSEYSLYNSLYCPFRDFDFNYRNW